ncbi:hypothetical protein Ddye_001707 [Dipteronia dyeriana]|uniref:F-box domain-containing protein n=1 Tax=Dipteronia dyeriana TaxID=168575 RepID=A0AAE0CU92_9ROSI|nr:hypothetical protein Ddye_001707 [Dipteronia dyeriana]
MSAKESVDEKRGKLENLNATRMESQPNVDRISNLPWVLLDTILVKLPLRDAARTSILSTKWRYKWTGLSKFVFDDKCFLSSLSGKVRWGECMRIINQIRSYHAGPVEKFKLAAFCSPHSSDLDQWILFLKERGIKEFILQDVSSIRWLKLPSFLFSCPQLSCLKLFGCICKIPSDFVGLNCLKSLQLTEVSIRSDALESLIRNCPILERLMVLSIERLAFLRIHNSNLKYLKINSKFEDICLENSMCLDSVDIHKIPVYRTTVAQQVEQGRPCNLVRVFRCLTSIKSLTLSGDFLEFLANGEVPESFRPVLNHLPILDLREVKFGSLKQVTVLVSVLRSCPNVEELIISVEKTHSSNPVLEFLVTLSLAGFTFSQLKVARIRGILGTVNEMEFINLVLACSPRLEILTVVTYGLERIPEIFFRHVEWASKDVKITSLTL